MQVFGIDWMSVVKIVGVDVMLGLDNAILIALACNGLPANLKAKAVFYGTGGAIVLRAILLVLADYVIGASYVKIVAGSYLVYVGYKLLTNSDGKEPHINASEKLWGAVQTIVIADFMMSLDNVLAVVSASQGVGEHSAIYAIAGILFSIPIIVMGAQTLSKIMERLPVIIWLGAGLLGWIGAEMIISDALLGHYIERVHAVMGDFTHAGYKLAGFMAVVLPAFAQYAARNMVRPSVETGDLQ